MPKMRHLTGYSLHVTEVQWLGGKIIINLRNENKRETSETTPEKCWTLLENSPTTFHCFHKTGVELPPYRLDHVSREIINCYPCYPLAMPTEQTVTK